MTNRSNRRANLLIDNAGVQYIKQDSHVVSPIVVNRLCAYPEEDCGRCKREEESEWAMALYVPHDVHIAA